MDRNYIVELIKDSRLQEAIKALEKASKGSHLHNDIIAISAAYAEYTRLNRNATENFQTLEVQRAKITNSLLSILDELKPEDLDNVTDTRYTAPQSAPASNKLYLYGIIGILSITLLIFIFSGNSTPKDKSENSVNESISTPNMQDNNKTIPNQTTTINDITQGVKYVEYRIKGEEIGDFTKTGSIWIENNNVTNFKFKEMSRQDGIILLRDDTRKMNILLDLQMNQIKINTDSDPTDKLLYQITHFE